MHGYNGIGVVAIDRIILCKEKPVPHICEEHGRCPYVALVLHGFVSHVGDGYYKTTTKGKRFLANISNN